jgi:nicotinate-nucleotide adenylyltransferase
MQKIERNLIGVFGGSFDPPHAGHLKISLSSIKFLKLKSIYWLVTKKNPFKDRAYFSLNERVKRCKKIIKKNRKIKIKYLEDDVGSSRTADIVKYLIKKEKKSKFFLILGSDNLIYFHKWKNWRYLAKKCQLVVFSRTGFDKKAGKSAIVKFLKKKNIIFIKNQKIDISSSKIRKTIF